MGKLKTTFNKFKKKIETDAVISFGYEKDLKDEENTKVFVRDKVVWNDYGTKTSPPRPFVKPFLKSLKVQELIKVTTSFKLSQGNLNKEVTKKWKQSINSVYSPKLASSTIESKRRKNYRRPTKPLVASGQMRDDFRRIKSK